MDKLALRTIVAVAGLVAAGLGLAGVAAAAPTDPSPTSTAPSSANPAPAPPKLSDAPVPLGFQPLDAGNGLFGTRRGSLPAATSPDIQQVPAASKLPSLAVTPLPAQSTSDAEQAGADASTADADQ